MIERKPSRSKLTSTEALAIGAELYSTFRRHVPLEGSLTVSAVAAVSAATGLSERQVRRLAVRFRANPVAVSLAPTPRGPKVGSHRILAAVRQAIEQLTAEIFLTKPPPTAALAAREIRGLLVAGDGDFRFAPDDVPSERTLMRLIGEICPPARAARRPVAGAGAIWPVRPIAPQWQYHFAPSNTLSRKFALGGPVERVAAVSAPMPSRRWFPRSQGISRNKIIFIIYQQFDRGPRVHTAFRAVRGAHRASPSRHRSRRARLRSRGWGGAPIVVVLVRAQPARAQGRCRG